MIRPDGAWIFLSHSNEDWDQVRTVRNLLEEKGHRPIMFFLKCLTEDSELDGLVKREIEARSWFLLCDSENAQGSKWVQSEVEYIKGLPDKYYEQIDLGSALELQIDGITRLSKRATVYLSYASADRPIALRIRDSLTAHDYSVWEATTPAPLQEMIERIDDAVARGFVLVLLSEGAAKSRWLAFEMEYAFKKASTAAHDANVLPVMLEDPTTILSALPPGPRSQLTRIHWTDFSQGDFDTNVAKLIASMKNREMD